jgi:hypothetical protein
MRSVVAWASFLLPLALLSAGGAQTGDRPAADDATRSYRVVLEGMT